MKRSMTLAIAVGLLTIGSFSAQAGQQGKSHNDGSRRNETKKDHNRDHHKDRKGHKDHCGDHSHGGCGGDTCSSTVEHMGGSSTGPKGTPENPGQPTKIGFHPIPLNNTVYGKLRPATTKKSPILSANAKHNLLTKLAPKATPSTNQKIPTLGPGLGMGAVLSAANIELDAVRAVGAGLRGVKSVISTATTAVDRLAGGISGLIGNKYVTSVVSTATSIVNGMATGVEGLLGEAGSALSDLGI
jgi:hypothetical protein